LMGYSELAPDEVLQYVEDFEYTQDNGEGI
jgi:hypothetical protein